MSLHIRSACRSSVSVVAMTTSAALLVGGLAACGGEEPVREGDSNADHRPSPVAVAAGTGSYPDAERECILLDPAQVEAAIGEGTATPAPLRCVANGSGGDAIVVYSARQDADDLTRFRAERDGDPAWSPVPAAGVTAYFTEHDEQFERPSLAVATETAFTLVVLYPADGDSYTAEEMIAMLAPIGATALDRMPVED